MSEHFPKLSIVIVTYNRSQVLIDTINYLLKLDDFEHHVHEMLIIDQTSKHTAAAEQALSKWHANNLINWIILTEPNLTGAMNLGLMEASREVVLYLDDDIIPDSQLLIGHIQAHQNRPKVAAIVGQILQPGEEPKEVDYKTRYHGIRAFMDFPFYSTSDCKIENAMAGNMSLKRNIALDIGGFDEQFIPPVAARFESEFAKRLLNYGEQIWFEPSASIRHLASSSGGTRARGSHLSSAQPYFGFGDYYFALLHAKPLECFVYCVRRFFREVRTKFHLRHPWYIPVKWLGEIRAFLMALKASRQPQKLISKVD